MSLLIHALHALQSGHLEAAIRLCMRLWQTNSGHADAAGLLAVLYARTGEPEKALEFAGQAIAARPDDSRFHFNRATIRETIGDETGAEADYGEACRLDGANLPARINLGNLLLRADRLADAADCFSATAAAFPEAAAAHEGLGVARQRQKRGGEARAALGRALALSPGHPRIEANLGWALLDDGQAADAAVHFERALAVWPGAADLWAGLALTQIVRESWLHALTAIDRALAIEPDHTRTLGFKGVVLDALGRGGERRALVDLDRLPWQCQLTDPPAGYADLAGFNRALAAYVLGHPSLVRNRAGKTTRNGGQTGGLAENEPGPSPVAALARWIRTAIDRSVGRAQKWRLRMWATVLHSGGYQDPHNHPSGRVSGVYYVRVPPTIGAGESDQSGWIEFGRPDPFLRPTIVPPLRTIQPAEGSMLVFPSHVWHRTIPFVGDEPRISIAFDAVPLREPDAADRVAAAASASAP